MKKVVFLIDNLKGGGAEKAIKIIVEGLQKKGFNPILILLEDQQDYTIDNNVQIYTLTDSITKYNFIFLGMTLTKLLKNIAPDIIYATNTKAQILSLVTKDFVKALRVINIQVDLTKQYEDRKYIFAIFNQLLNKSDIYSFISQGIYENLKSHIPNKKKVFIPNAIDFTEIDKMLQEPLEEQYEAIFEKKTFITIGRLTKQKGQWILLEAFTKLPKDTHLVILGSGEKEQELKTLAQELQIDNRVFFLGFQKNPFKFLYHADIFVLSSLWEGFGNVIVEAMRCNLPIISTDCPSGPREILAPRSIIGKSLSNNIEFCEYGILVPVNNSDLLAKSMNKLYKEKFLQQHYKNRSIQRALEYSSDKIVDLFIKNILEGLK